MTELLVGASAWWIVPVSLLVFGATFGFLPGILLRLLVLLYPREDCRRQELFAELYAPEVSRLGRFEWVFQQLETALREGLTARREARKKRKSHRVDESDPHSSSGETQTLYDQLVFVPWANGEAASGEMSSDDRAAIASRMTTGKDVSNLDETLIAGSPVDPVTRSMDDDEEW